MPQKVVYVQATDSNPNTQEIERHCLEMAGEGLTLQHVFPSLANGGATQGFWLFFVGSNHVAEVGAFATQTLQPIRRAVAMANQPSDEPLAFWRDIRAKKGLGASLTITGLLAGMSGIILHFALQNDLINSSIHLGYFFGLIGLFLFLIGLVIVF